MNQFEFPLGDENPEQRHKRERMESAAEHYPWLLSTARAHARRLAKLHGITDIEEVREAMEKEGTFPIGASREELNWMGSTFTTGEFYRAGDRPAWHQHSNGRRVLRWGLKR